MAIYMIYIIYMIDSHALACSANPMTVFPAITCSSCILVYSPFRGFAGADPCGPLVQMRARCVHA